MPDLMTEPLTTAALVERVAASLHARIGDLSNSMRERLSTRIDELENGGAIFELLYASIEGNVENIFHLLRHDIVVQRTGVRLFFADPKLGQHVENHSGLDLEFPR